MYKWQDPSLSLGERCVLFSKNEMDNGVSEDKLNSFTSPRLREYFKICTRLYNNKETAIGVTFTAGNWCAAGVSFSLYKSLLPGEFQPHGYRLGVIEIMSDMKKQDSLRAINEVHKSLYFPKVGDLIFFDRSNPNDPKTAWWRHIGRVYDVNNKSFDCISGNSSGKWKITNHSFYQKNLLGFGDYSSQTAVANPNVQVDWSNFSLDQLAPKVDTGKDLVIDNMWDAFSIIKK